LKDEEPTDRDRARRSADHGLPLTIFFTQSQIDVRRTLSTEQLGDLSRFRTGFLYLDGRGMSPDTHLIFNGQVHRYDGEVEDHLFVMHPRFVPSADGAANASGFLIVDFKRDAYRQVVTMFGHLAGSRA